MPNPMAYYIYAKWSYSQQRNRMLEKLECRSWYRGHRWLGRRLCLFRWAVRDYLMCLPLGDDIV